MLRFLTSKRLVLRDDKGFGCVIPSHIIENVGLQGDVVTLTLRENGEFVKSTLSYSSPSNALAVFKAICLQLHGDSAIFINDTTRIDNETARA